jgi:PAS domain S-box-containing protein
MDSDIVLIAITDIDLLKILEKELATKKYTVLTAEPDQRLFDSISAKAPSALVLDINLINNNSRVELADRIKKIYDLPIIFLSDSPEEKIYEQARLINPTAFFSKPFDSKNITRAIELGINNHRFHKEIADIKNKYELVIRAANAGVYEIDPITLEIDADEQFIKIFGYTKTEVKELGWGSLMPIEDFNKKKELLSDLLHGKIGSYCIEHRVIKKNGEIA